MQSHYETKMTFLPPKILIVDDCQQNLLLMESLLAGIKAELHTASSGKEAVSLVADNNFALILLDVWMPDMNGFEAAQIMRSSNHVPGTPIIFVTANAKKQQDILQGYDCGAVDFLFKPVDAKILISKVAFFLEQDRQKKELEAANQALVKQKSALEKLAIHDDLTGLYNRRHLNEMLQQEFARCERYNIDCSCMMIDLDHFKSVNDMYGHGFGDMVIRTFAIRLSERLRGTDFIFRFGGEEFLILLPQTDISGAQQVAHDICRHNEKKEFTFSAHRANVTASIGLSSFREHQPKVHNDLINMADKALYVAKENGRNRVEVYQ